VLAAVAGSTGKEWDRSICIYVFDARNGQLLRRLSGLPASVMDLAFSDNGRALAAVLLDGKGLRVWETTGWTPIGRDEDYGGQSSSRVDWHGEERLATTCHDGVVRLYRFQGGKLESLARQPAKGGKAPYGVSFSPDGQQIAVGFADSPSVAVLDGNDLSFRFAPSTADVRNGSLAKVVWSADGTSLVAGGDWRIGNAQQLRRWTQTGRGTPKDAGAFTGTLMDVRPLGGSAILFGSTNPTWGVLTAGGQAKLLGESPLADFSGQVRSFHVSADGETVRFGFRGYGREPALFSISNRRLVVGPKVLDEKGLNAADVASLDLTEWSDTVAPKLAGQPLRIAPLEMARSVAISKDTSFFVMGTGWNLRSFTAAGVKRWTVPAPGVAWAVNVTADGRLAVAAYDDGTIRWHRAEDGRELLAFFPHADKRRWVLWTPEGNFDCSEGAEGLIGWHVNQGKEKEALFHPVAKFSKQFHRPDLVQQALKQSGLEDPRGQ
jgi:hypothetical protein